MYASFGKRLLAFLIDGLILSVVGGLVTTLLGGTNPQAITQALETGNLGPLYMAYAPSSLLALLYYTFMESSDRQATVGKIAMNIKVVGKDGGKISPFKAFLRYIGRMISGFILLIGYIMAAFTPKQQALHDMIAGTYVVGKDTEYIEEYRR